MITVANIPGEFHYRSRCVINAVELWLEFRWNERDNAWYMSMYDLEDDPIFEGEKVALGALIGARKRYDPRWPGGCFLADDTSGANVEAGLDDLGARVQLRYFTRDEALAVA